MLDDETFSKLDLNKIDKFNGNILITAVIYNKENLVKKLLETNIDINKKDVNERTALYWAVALLRPNLVKLLLNKNADQKIRSGRHTSLSWAKYLQDNKYTGKDKKDIEAIIALLVDNV